jgi:hypothetical protein
MVYYKEEITVEKYIQFEDMNDIVDIRRDWVT